MGVEVVFAARVLVYYGVLLILALIAEHKKNVKACIIIAILAAVPIAFGIGYAGWDIILVAYNGGVL